MLEGNMFRDLTLAKVLEMSKFEKAWWRQLSTNKILANYLRLKRMAQREAFCFG
jgi:hypothetical protein